MIIISFHHSFVTSIVIGRSHQVVLRVGGLRDLPHLRERGGGGNSFRDANSAASYHPSGRFLPAADEQPFPCRWCLMIWRLEDLSIIGIIYELSHGFIIFGFSI